jgi:glucose-6-phosphate isomerase
MPPIVIDVNNVLATAIGERGIAAERFQRDLAQRFREAHAKVAARHDAGDMGFLDLPHADETASRVQEVADSFGQWFENLVVLGIGGSALGARFVRDALLGPLWNQLSAEGREHFPRLYVLDNADPSSVRDLLSFLDIRRTLFNVVSKSGSTAETMAQYLVVRDRLERAVGPENVAGHFLFTTSPTRGSLRATAEADGVPTLAIPENVGGRFSVLSPVGLLPAAATGVDTRALLGGAAAMVQRCGSPELLENPAGLLATALHTAHTESGAAIHVLMPYADRLRSLSLWFQQLWAESLGKAVTTDGRTVHSGPTPLPAVGATDQHAQVQLFMEGPFDKVIVFLAVHDMGDPVPIPPGSTTDPGLSYLGGHSIGALLDAERRATTEALRRRGRPSMTIEIDRIDADRLGRLIMLFELATVYAAALYDVDALDQPGVELGKELTYGLLGRDGFDAVPLGQGDPRWRVNA